MGIGLGHINRNIGRIETLDIWLRKASHNFGLTRMADPPISGKSQIQMT